MKLVPFFWAFPRVRRRPSYLAHRVTTSLFYMKTVFDSAPLVRQPSTNPTGLCLMLVLGTAIFVAGCGKGKNAEPAATTAAPLSATQENTSSPTAPSPAAANPVADPQPPPAVVITDNAGAPVLQQLNRALIQFKFRNHRVPSSFEDFADNGNIQVPPPPAGKKYAIDGRGIIVLVDSSTR